jgi:ATP/maltotriose-dependent transcriptional regulator MalT
MLLSTKLHIPPVRSELVSRPRLLARLNTGLDSRLTLVSAPAGYGKTTLLVLDDYHLITAQPVHDVLTFLLDHSPRNLHLVIATRADPPLSLTRLRGQGQLTELRQSDLRFTPGEAFAFLHRVAGLSLAESDVGVLADRTEGWVVGTQRRCSYVAGSGSESDTCHGANRCVVG